MSQDEASLGKLVASIRDYAIFMLDSTGHVRTWNEGARLIKGYEADEIIGSHFSRFYPRDRIESRWPEHELEQAANNGRFEDESWRVRKDGSQFWANVVITALYGDRGEVVGFAKVTRDLTERWEHEQQLKQSEERFRSLVEGVSDYAIFMLDKNGHVTTWNAGAEKLKGYRADEIIGSHISKFYEREPIQRGWPQHELKIATLQGRFEDEGWRVRKDGSRFWASVVITALRDRAGHHIGFSKITRDLTERKEHERRLEESEERFRLVVQSVTDYAIIMLDTGGEIRSWNDGARQIVGYELSEMAGKHAAFLYPAEDVSASVPWRQLVTALEKGRVAEEGWRVRKDRTQFWASSITTPLYDADGRHRGYVQVLQDLSKRRLAETLADTSRRMHEFIAMLAHELRNPLAPIRNAVELMAERGLGDPVLEAMRATIDRQSAGLARIVDDLLDVNRISRGHLSIEKQTIDLCDVVNRALEASKPGIEGAGQTLSVDVCETPILVTGDALRLTQALTNLLNNASRYTPRGGWISLKLERELTEIVLRVRDNGRGIDPADLERVFDLFTRVGIVGDEEQRAGLGVGLALVRGVVELHSGTARAYSAGIGRGSEFVVRLPMPESRPERVHVDEGRATKKVLPPLKIVVADDNSDGADSLRLLLQAFGHEVHVAYDGPGAVDAITRLRPDVAVLDIGMPGMTGYEVADQLKGTLGDSMPRLVALTGWGQRTDKDEAERRGFSLHFTKPISAAELQEALAAIR